MSNLILHFPPAKRRTNTMTTSKVLSETARIFAAPYTALNGPINPWVVIK